MDENQQELVAQFCAVTGANPNSAQGALTSANWNLEEAVALYFAAQDEPADRDNDADDDDWEYETQPVPQPSNPTPAQPSAQPSSSSSQPPRKPPTQRPKQMTMDELRKRNEERDDDNSEDDKPQDMFAGGEKSGLAVQNPGQSGGGGGGAGGPTDHFKNIMNQARQNRDRPAAGGGGGGGGEDGEPTTQQRRPPPPSNFTGRAVTLGGDDAESQIIEDPTTTTATGPHGAATNRNTNLPPERVSRTLHLWADGISIDDGPLFRFDDPANQNIMAEINRGRAPLALLDVQPDQEVDLNLEPHKDENFVQPKKIYRPFGGEGQRLGSPTPSAATATTATAAPSSSATQAPSAAASSANAAAGGQPKVEVDDSQPTLQLQIRLGDGTRLSSRFNTTHTIGDVYDFVDRAAPNSTQRAYALMTTFPSKELEDRSVVLGELGEFKRGGVVVQKWK